MPYCKYCKEFQGSIRRLTPKGEDGEKKKYIPIKRLCGVTKQWKDEHDELCDSFTSCGNFFCDYLQCWLHVDACRNKKAKKLSKHCRRCKQYNDVLETIRCRTRKPEIEPEIEMQPVILRRRAHETIKS